MKKRDIKGLERNEKRKAETNQAGQTDLMENIARWEELDETEMEFNEEILSET